MVCAYICYGTFYTWQGCHCCTLNFPWSQWIYIVVGCSKLLLLLFFFRFLQKSTRLEIVWVEFCHFTWHCSWINWPVRFTWHCLSWYIFNFPSLSHDPSSQYSAKLESHQWGSPFPSKGLKDLFPTLFVTKQIFTPTKFVLVSDLLHLKRMIWTSIVF